MFIDFVNYCFFVVKVCSPHINWTELIHSLQTPAFEFQFVNTSSVRGLPVWTLPHVFGTGVQFRLCSEQALSLLFVAAAGDAGWWTVHARRQVKCGWPVCRVADHSTTPAQSLRPHAGTCHLTGMCICIVVLGCLGLAFITPLFNGWRSVLSVLLLVPGGWVAEWLACWTQAQKAWVQIAVVTLFGNSLRQSAHTHCAFVHQAAKLVAALLKIAGVTAGLAESNGSLLPGLWLTSPAGWLPRTGISSGTVCSVIECGLPLPFFYY